MVNYQWDWCPWIEASQHRGIQSTTVIINIIIIIIIIIIIVMIITGKRSTKEEDEWIMGVCTQLICLLWSYSLCVCLFVPIWTSPSGVPLRRTPPAASRQRRMTSSPFQWRHPSCNKMTPPPPHLSTHFLSMQMELCGTISFYDGCCWALVQILWRFVNSMSFIRMNLTWSS